VTSEHRKGHAHAANSITVVRKAITVLSVTRSCDDPPATTSNGDPPPESVFDNCGFAATVGFAAALLLDEEALDCTLVGACDVGLGSVRIAPDDVLDG
jgi:hypothetical protein